MGIGPNDTPLTDEIEEVEMNEEMIQELSNGKGDDEEEEG
jgi:hypothetical protein